MKTSKQTCPGWWKVLTFSFDNNKFEEFEMKSSHKYFSPAESWKMSVIFNLKLFQLTKRSMSQHNKIKHKYKLKKWQKIHCYIFPPILALNLVLNCKTYNFDEVFPLVFFLHLFSFTQTFLMYFHLLAFSFQYIGCYTAWSLWHPMAFSGL